MPRLLGSGCTVLKKAHEAMSIQSGLILEFGVRHGSSIRQLASCTSIPIYGFDSFEGLPEDWHQESKEIYSTRGKIPKVPSHVTLIPGWFDQTLPLFLEKHDEDVALINIDCDIYSSTKTVLDLLNARIKKAPSSYLMSILAIFIGKTMNIRLLWKALKSIAGIMNIFFIVPTLNRL
jgi:hypothetical protein